MFDVVDCLVGVHLEVGVTDSGLDVVGLVDAELAEQTLGLLGLNLWPVQLRGVDDAHGAGLEGRAGSKVRTRGIGHTA